MHWIFAGLATVTGVVAGFGSMKIFPKAVSLFSSSPGIIAAVIWPVLAVFALAGAAQRAIGSSGRAACFALGYLFISMASLSLTLAIASPWSGISMSGQHLSGTPRELR